MIHTTHSARIIGPIPYIRDGGKTGTIPLGPCLIEQIDDRSFDIVWGTRGQSSTVLRAEDIKAAADVGNLLLLN
jgi:hypothetical protein